MAPWFIDAFSHFQVQYFYLLLGLSIVAFLGRKHWFAIFCLGVASVNLFFIVPYLSIFQPPPVTAAEEDTYRILAANLSLYNDSLDDFFSLVEEENPDILFLAEVTPEHARHLKALYGEYPYRTPAIWENTNALYSRLETNHIEYFDFNLAYSEPSPVVEMIIEDKIVTIFGAHLTSPIGPSRSSRHDKQLDLIAKSIYKSESAFIVVGDLNITPWSLRFQAFVEETGLVDSRRGRGILATWPESRPIFYIPIDHFLATPEIKIHDYRLGASIGSDHLPIVIDFSIADTN